MNDTWGVYNEDGKWIIKEIKYADCPDCGYLIVTTYEDGVQKWRRHFGVKQCPKHR